jgi:hypothetical protein
MPIGKIKSFVLFVRLSEAGVKIDMKNLFTEGREEREENRNMAFF